MKKIFFILLLVFLSACTVVEDGDKDKTLREFIDEINLNTEITEDLDLPEYYTFNGQSILAIWESDNTAVLSDSGKINRVLVDTEVNLSLTLTTDNEIETKYFIIKVKSLTDREVLNSVLERITITNETKVNINLPNSVTAFGQRFDITWASTNEDALSITGKVGLIENDENVTLSAKAQYNNTDVTVTYPVKVIALSDDEKADYITDLLDLPRMTSQDLNLETSFPFGLTATWESSDHTAIDNTGKINQNLSGNKEVTLTLALSNGIRRTFELTISKNNHLVIDSAFSGTKENLQIVNNNLVLTDNNTSGTYESEVIDTLSFNELVGSWAATSSTVATVDFMVRVRVGSTWSKYFSYGKWGYGLNNKTANSSDSVAYMSIDEIKISGGKTANAIQFKAILERTNVSDDSPELSMLVAALNIPGYSFVVDTSNLPNEKVYDVPKLYQIDVPSIGDSICSPTSATMLLMYLGHDIENLDDNNYDYPHQYIAYKAFDHGANIFGNWVYNTVTISAFGVDSYVMRMYSYQELLVHLNEVGPVSASIKGYVVNESGRNYTTNGHLIVVKGYRYDGDQLYISVNDPNVSIVDVEMKIDNFMNVWRNVVYIVE